MMCRTWLTPLLVLTVSLCVLRFCCKICSKVSDTGSDLDLSNSDHVYVIPNPIHVRVERDEQDEMSSHDDSEFTPPPYDLVCPPPSYEVHLSSYLKSCTSLVYWLIFQVLGTFQQVRVAQTSYDLFRTASAILIYRIYRSV